jgi:outer membrane immunogenic protein
MIRRIFVAAAFVSLSQAALAADLLNYTATAPIRPMAAFTWTGLHLGVSGGYGFNADDPSYSYVNVPSFIVPLLPKQANLNADGGLVGGTVGLDRQFGQWVLGVEGDISWTDFGENAVRNNPPGGSFGLPPLRFATDYQMDWLSTIRGRAGFAFDRWMLYGTGGFAFANVSLESTVTVGAPAQGRLFGSDDKTKTGWTAGGGGAFALTDHISLKAEALYYDLGNISVHATNPDDPQGSELITKQDINGTIVRGGIDYRF